MTREEMTVEEFALRCLKAQGSYAKARYMAEHTWGVSDEAAEATVNLLEKWEKEAR